MFYDVTGEVKQYPYRTAQVRNHFLCLDRNSNDVRNFEEKLAVAANARPDNHTVYTITQGGNTVCVFFHDLMVIFGWALVEERW